ncbi:MAG: outer membrane beta-barrel protein [Dyadobacter sp.]|uniref:outer membrane beta-barrel protein n=1 Tax=Dyadobacter sp. TaxID=1914288 RepID=UPI00326741FA
MKRLLPILFVFLASVSAYAQSTELSLQLSSGIYRYGGKSAATNSYLFVSDLAPHYNVNTPFGKNSELSYGIGIQAQRVTRKHFLWGLRAGYDKLSVSTRIENYTSMGGNLVVTEIENGKAKLNTQVIRANPYFGYRLKLKHIKLDLTTGLNLGYILKSSEYVTYYNQNSVFDKKSDYTKVNTKFDFGPTAGLAVSYKRVAVSAEYIHGLINYQRMMDGANPEVYSRYVRFGIGYRLF